MNKTEFCGDISTGDSRAVSAALRDWLQGSALKEKDRMFGFEITYDDGSIDFYCYEATALSGIDSAFLIEGTISSLDFDPEDKLAELVRCCATYGLRCAIDYTEVDADGDPIGNDKTIDASIL